MVNDIIWFIDVVIYRRYFDWFESDFGVEDIMGIYFMGIGVLVFIEGWSVCRFLLKDCRKFYK